MPLHHLLQLRITQSSNPIFSRLQTKEWVLQLVSLWSYCLMISDNEFNTTTICHNKTDFHLDYYTSRDCGYMLLSHINEFEKQGIWLLLVALTVAYECWEIWLFACFDPRDIQILLGKKTMKIAHQTGQCLEEVTCLKWCWIRNWWRVYSTSNDEDLGGKFGKRMIFLIHPHTTSLWNSSTKNETIGKYKPW